MRWTVWKLPFAILFFAVSSVAFARSQGSGSATQNGKITVLVYNYAHLPERSLEHAKRVTEVIFRQSGLVIVWKDCRTAPSMDATDASIEQPLADGILILRIVSRVEPAMGIPTTNETMGLSFGNLALVSLEAIREAALGGVGMPLEILGAAIAHELGHLLLGPHSHSATGIMQPGWSHEGSDRRRLSALTFTPQQAESIRSVVRKQVNENAEGTSTIALK